ncbi:OmpP1/FadL family transporter [Jiulongibacter sp. NS-SX5]|uniref:OmpP1/FadL family transporter n=1 Tax=Jiulongibacter sp. NS-SX5 TaxID=3463854 RepID=UPI004058D035
MKKYSIIILVLLLGTTMAQAQVNLDGHFYGQDAFKFSQYQNYGTARTAAMGGAFTALGGDASNTFVNPAGLGFYNRSEFSISPNFKSSGSTASYLGQSTGRNSTNSSIGHASVVFNRKNRRASSNKSSFGISYNNLVNFYNEFDYSGSNNASSMMDYFAEQATFSGASPADLDAEFDPVSGVAQTPEALYYQAYLIDPYENGYVVVEPSFPVSQSGRVTESGNLGQLNFSYGINLKDKTYLGAGVGIQSLNYNSINAHQEDFPNGEIFNAFVYQDELVVRGTGINLSLGVIHRVTDEFRIGFNVTTPTAMSVNETFYSAVSIDQKPNTFETDFSTVELVPGTFDYKITSPLRATAGVGYILPNKIGVISAEAEYVGYGGMNVRDKQSETWTSEQNRAIGDVYKDVLNFKGGAEMRLGKARVRGGVNYLADPYSSDNGIDRSSLILSGGAGFRSAKFFADVSYSGTRFNSAYTPYVLSVPENYDTAVIDQKSGTLTITVGTFF